MQTVSENETVEDIAKMMRRNEEVFHHLYWCEYADRIEAAHKREVAELKCKVAELRECLKETMVDAVAEYKNNSCFRNVKCGEIERCKTCKIARWRKALKGAGDEGK